MHGSNFKVFINCWQQYRAQSDKRPSQQRDCLTVVLRPRSWCSVNVAGAAEGSEVEAEQAGIQSHHFPSTVYLETLDFSVFHLENKHLILQFKITILFQNPLFQTNSLSFIGSVPAEAEIHPAGKTKIPAVGGSGLASPFNSETL